MKVSMDVACSFLSAFTSLRTPVTNRNTALILVPLYTLSSPLLHPLLLLKDIDGAMTPSEISMALGLSALKNRTWQIFKTSAIKGEGLEEAMEW